MIDGRGRGRGHGVSYVCPVDALGDVMRWKAGVDSSCCPAGKRLGVEEVSGEEVMVLAHSPARNSAGSEQEGKALDTREVAVVQVEDMATSDSWEEGDTVEFGTALKIGRAHV